MSKILSDNSQELDEIYKFFTDSGIENTTLNDRKLIKQICQIVFNRSARIAAIFICAIIRKIDPLLVRPHTIAVNGSLYEKAAGYKESLLKNINNILNQKESKIKIIPSKDGSGIGAAIVAATVSH